jgi:O-succinylhomoserine sulfhydrylase
VPEVPIVHARGDLSDQLASHVKHIAKEVGVAFPGHFRDRCIGKHPHVRVSASNRSMNLENETMPDYQDLPDNISAQSAAVHGGLLRSSHMENAEAIYMTSGFVYESAEEAEAAFKGEIDRYVYSRYANPTVSMFEERLRLLEGAEACMGVGSGMAAVFAALACQLSAGDRLVASRALFSSCHVIATQILPRYGIETELVDGADLDAWEAALSKPAKVVFLETPSNPTLEIIDLAAVAKLAKGAGACLVVDNVFATPIFQKPLELGADVVTYSTTKHIDGQGRSLGGAVLGSADFVEEKLLPFLRHTGPALSPFNAWVAVKGLETLELRVRAEADSAAKVADFLADHPAVAQSIYPGRNDCPGHEIAARQMSGFGALVSFRLNADKAGCFKALNALRLIKISNNLGDAKSLICHPDTSTHAKTPQDEKDRLNIGPDLLRLSVGLESADDLIRDLDQALTATG